MKSPTWQNLAIKKRKNYTSGQKSQETLIHQILY